MKQIMNSLNLKVLKYLIIFSLTLLAVLWFLQVVSLSKFYELSVKNEIDNVVNEIKERYKENNYEDYLNEISFKNNMCIEIYDNVSALYSSISCYKESIKLTKEKRDFIFNNREHQGYELVDKKVNSKILMYGFKLENQKFAFVQVMLEPVNSTVHILKNQLLIVSIFVGLLSIIMAFFISRKIAKPIEKITENAKKVANGEYDVEIDYKTTVSEIKDLNETLKYTSEELAKTENLRRELLSNVSHDLKTPLTMIKAYAEMVRDLTYNNKKKREANLNVIIEESDRLNLLVNDILELSKYQSNTIKLEYSEFDINDLIKEILKRYSIYIDKEGYKILFKNKKVIMVYADRKRISQVIYNLLNNAINYSNEEKIIDIEVIDKDNENIEVKITNKGEGIKEEEIQLIWDKYYKVDKTYSRVQVGTGIGLSIVKNILDLHNSKYGVTSKLNDKTTFYFELKKR
ncbi:MAG: HAMP domain-containing histidine kinase [Bacilli bacterium]|nr:HAMP domain-containing histidine kinase [Bacilli bacterium]